MCITEYDEAETLKAIGNERFAEGKLEGKAEGKTEGIAIGKAEGQAERDATYKAQLSKMVNAGIVSEEAAQQLLDIGELAKCKFFFPSPLPFLFSSCQFLWENTRRGTRGKHIIFSKQHIYNNKSIIY